MKKLFKWLLKYSLILLLLALVLFAAAAEVLYEMYYRPVKVEGPQIMAADLSRPTQNRVADPEDVIVTGRRLHHQQSEPTLFGMKETITDKELIRSRTLEMEIPTGGMLTFDLYIPPPLLMNPAEYVRFEVEATLPDSAEPAKLFKHRYYQDWVWWIIDQARERSQLFYRFVDRFRHFSVDLSEYAGQKTRLTFKVTAPKSMAVAATAEDNAAVQRFRKRSNALFNDGMTFAAPRIWTGEKPGPKEFNVVLCIVDGMRADALSLYGGDEEIAPNIKKLAQGGALVEKAFSPSNATRNSTSALLAGRYPSTLGLPLHIWELNDQEKAAARILTGMGSSTVPSMPRYFAGRGYATAMIGANPFLLPGNEFAADMGFTQNEAMNQRAPSTEAIHDRAVRFIEQNQTRPFFLYLHFDNGHGPLLPPDEFLDRFPYDDDDPVDKWESLYKADLAYADSKIGSLIDTLAQLNLTKNTLFIVTADHGVVRPGEDGHPSGHAHSLYEGDTHVPLIFYLPSALPAGKKVPGLWSLLDVFPTLVHLQDGASIEKAGAVSRISDDEQTLVFNGRPIPVKDDIPAGDTDRAVYMEGSRIFALRTADHRLILKSEAYPGMDEEGADGGRLSELYDLNQDPDEKVNLSGLGTDDENDALTRLWGLRSELAKSRAEQVEFLRKYLGGKSDTLYPTRFEEAYHVRLVAGEKPQRYVVVVDTEHWVGSYLGYELQPGDSVVSDDGRTYAAFLVQVPAGGEKTFGFTPFPEDDLFTLEVVADDEPLPGIFVGPHSLPFDGNPRLFGNQRDFRLMNTKTDPSQEEISLAGAYIWRIQRDKDATTKMGGEVQEALRSWGYVK